MPRRDLKWLSAEKIGVQILMALVFGELRWCERVCGGMKGRRRQEGEGGQRCFGEGSFGAYSNC